MIQAELEKFVLAHYYHRDPGEWAEQEADLHEDFFADPRSRKAFRALRSFCRSTEEKIFALESKDVELDFGNETPETLMDLKVYLATVPDHFPQREPAWYVDKLKDAYGIRELRRLSSDLMCQVDASDDPSEVIAEHVSRIRAIEEMTVRGATVDPIGKNIDAYVEELMTVPAGDILGIPYGIPKIDYFTQGIDDGNVIVLGGRPGQGKSSLGMQIAVYNAKRGRHVYYASLEMNEKELTYRILSQMTGVGHSRIRSRHLNDAQKIRIEQARDKLRDYPLYIDDEATSNPDDLMRRIQRQHHRTPLDLIVVDYLQLLRGGYRKNQNRADEMSHITQSFKRMAKAICPVIELSQFSRQEHNEPRLSDFKESSSIEENADVCIGIHRPECGTEGKTDEGLLLVLKNRHGMTGKAEVVFQRESVTFTEKGMEREMAQVAQAGMAGF